MTKAIKELSKWKELLFHLAIKELKVRYKNAALGFLWAFLNPLLMMVVLTLIFTKVFRIQVQHYPLFLLCGLLPWWFLSMSISNSTSSLVDNASLIQKVYFPRYIIPFSIICANLVNFIISICILLVFLCFFGIIPIQTVWYLPIIILFQVILITGISLITSHLNAHFRDVRYITEVLLLVWFYASPIFYPLSMVPRKIAKFYIINPMAGIITSYREILLHKAPLPLNLFLTSAAISILILAIGILISKKYDATIADFV